MVTTLETIAQNESQSQLQSFNFYNIFTNKNFKLKIFFNKRMNLTNLFEGYADTALAAWNDPKSKSGDQKSSKFYYKVLCHIRYVQST